MKAEIHREPEKTRPSLQSVRGMIKHCKNSLSLAEQLARNTESQRLAEQIEVLEDNGALKGDVTKVKKERESRMSSVWRKLETEAVINQV